MEQKLFVSWRRVSTAKQRGSHLGLDAQKSIIQFFVEREHGKIIADFEECHSGTDLAGCAELQKAKVKCKETGATLIIAKTDRCRDTIEALQLYEEMNGNIYFCDLPRTDKFTLTLFFSLAEREAMIVGIRTKQALAEKKKQGAKLGASNESYKASVAAKSKDEIKEWNDKKGVARHEKFLDSRDVRVFRTVLQKTFPDLTKNKDSKKWKWGEITTRKKWGRIMVGYVKEYHGIDNSLFESWPFGDDKKLLQRVRNMIQNYKKSINL